LLVAVAVGALVVWLGAVVGVGVCVGVGVELTPSDDIEPLVDADGEAALGFTAVLVSVAPAATGLGLALGEELLAEASAPVVGSLEAPSAVHDATTKHAKRAPAILRPPSEARAEFEWVSHGVSDIVSPWQ
jgi:hypothetical protein